MTTPGTPPSAQAVRRLDSHVRQAVGDYRSQTQVDLAEIGRLVTDGLAEPGGSDRAARVLSQNLAELAALSDRLRSVVAAAAVEREAERVISAAPSGRR